MKVDAGAGKWECLMNKVYYTNSYQMQSVHLLTQNNQNSYVLTGLLDKFLVKAKKM